MKRTHVFYKGVSRNITRQQQQRSSQFGYLKLPKGVSLFKEEVNSKMMLDILPYTVTDPCHMDKDEEYDIATMGNLWYKHPFYLHRDIGPTNDSVVCPQSAKKRCPVCDHKAQLMKEGMKFDDPIAKALKASLRNLYVVIPKGEDKYPETPHIWDISQFVFQEKLNEEIQENEEYECFPDLETGLTLRIRFGEAQIGTNKFADVSRIDFIERKHPYKEAIMEQVPSLDDILIVPSYEELSTLFFEGESVESPNDEDKKEEEEKEKIKEEEEKEKIQNTNKEEEEKEKIQNTDKEEEEEKESPPDKNEVQTKIRAEIRRRKRPTTETIEEELKCPSGHTWGKDCDKYDECDECKKWDECFDNK